jgi:hypothetical protein
MAAVFESCPAWIDRFRRLAAGLKIGARAVAAAAVHQGQLQAELLKQPVFGIELAAGIDAFAEAIRIKLQHFAAALHHHLGVDALEAGLITEPHHFLMAEAQGMVEVLEAAVATEGDDRAGFAAELKDVAAMHGSELTPHRGEAFELLECLINLPVAPFGQ